MAAQTLPVGQTLPQLPQLLLSTPGSVQVPLQQAPRRPASTWQRSPSASTAQLAGELGRVWQPPKRQVFPAGQTVPQSPQLAGSKLTSRQLVPPQHRPPSPEGRRQEVSFCPGLQAVGRHSSSIGVPDWLSRVTQSP